MEINAEKIYEGLYRVGPFKTLTSDEIKRLKIILQYELFDPGDTILKEGDKGDKLYIIIGGQVDIQKKTMYGEDYTCAHLSAGENCFFGEVSLLDSDVRTATVKALTEVKSLSVSHDELMFFCDSNPSIGYKIMRALAEILCSKLRKADRDILVLFEALVEEIGTDINPRCSAVTL